MPRRQRQDPNDRSIADIRKELEEDRGTMQKNRLLRARDWDVGERFWFRIAKIGPTPPHLQPAAYIATSPVFITPSRCYDYDGEDDPVEKNQIVIPQEAAVEISEWLEQEDYRKFVGAAVRFRVDTVTHPETGRPVNGYKVETARYLRKRKKRRAA
jgi:hypothetical protein